MTPIPPDQQPPAEKKEWRVGTLHYTYAGIVSLFAVLLCGDFVWNLRDRSVAPMSQWYLDNLGIPNWLFGLLLTTFPALLGFVLGPVISVRSDRHRGPRGRRIPYLIWTTPIAAAGMVGIGITPMIASWLHSLGSPDSALGVWLHGLLDNPGQTSALLCLLEDKKVISVLCFGVFWAVFEVAAIVSIAVFNGLINDVVPQELLGRFYGLFRAISLLVGIFFNFWIMGMVPSHFTLILVIIGVTYGLAFYWVCLRVKEGEYPPPPPPLEGGRVAEVKGYFRDCFSNPYYLWVFFAITMGVLYLAPVNIFAIPYATSLGMSMDTYGKCLALTYALSLCLSYTIGWLADRFHPLLVGIASLGSYMVIALLGWLLVHDVTTFAIFLVLHGVASGCYYTGTASLTQRLFPRSKFAQFASAAGMIGSIGTMAIAPAVGMVIDIAGRDYRQTFGIGAVLAAIGLVSTWHVYRQYMRLGGATSYVAPE